MATAMTFDSLQEDLRKYLERGTSVDPSVFEQLPRLINLAERDIAQSLKILGFINVVTGAMSPGLSTYPKPDRWRETVSINFGVGATQVRTPLFPRSYEYIRTYWSDEDLTDQPEFYADYGYYNWLFGPTPDLAYPFEITYYQLPALLDAANQTNWTTDLAPNALLHGSLLQATEFLKNDERIPMWQAAYNQDMLKLQEQDISRIVDRTSTRDKV